MNLKEAFRYQNKLQRLMEEAQEVLARERNVTKVENTALRHKVCSEAEDETTVEMPETEYREQIAEVAELLSDCYRAPFAGCPCVSQLSVYRVDLEYVK